MPSICAGQLRFLTIGTNAVATFQFSLPSGAKTSMFPRRFALHSCWLVKSWGTTKKVRVHIYIYIIIYTYTSIHKYIYIYTSTFFWHLWSIVSGNFEKILTPWHFRRVPPTWTSRRPSWDDESVGSWHPGTVPWTPSHSWDLWMWKIGIYRYWPIPIYIYIYSYREGDITYNYLQIPVLSHKSNRTEFTSTRQ